jgi:hypothetical protein
LLERADKKESISSIKIIEGCNCLAILKRALANFSASPKYLAVRLAADIAKNVACKKI